MHKGSILKAAALLAVILPAGAARAQFSPPNPNTPPGLQGKDWDSTAFTLTSGRVALLVAVNATQDVGNGNWSGFEVYVDGVRQPDVRAYQATAATTILVGGAGYHNVQIRCTNFHATARLCRLNPVRIEEVPAL